MQSDSTLTVLKLLQNNLSSRGKRTKTTLPFANQYAILRLNGQDFHPFEAFTHERGMASVYCA